LAKRAALRSKARAVCRALDKRFGPATWEPTGDPVGGLVRTILSQNTSDVNSGRAWDALRARFGDLGRVRTARPAAIEAAIRVGGLARIKSARIRDVLRAIHAAEGSLTLDRLRDFSPAGAIALLRAYRGVGAKTAHCVLLFDLGVPVFPVDTHILRITKRLGLVPERATLDAAHDALRPVVPPELAYSLHVHLIAHGRATCRPKPRCDACILTRWCGYYRRESAARG
jgi:endonuclease-3